MTNEFDARSDVETLRLKNGELVIHSDGEQAWLQGHAINLEAMR